MKLLIATLMLIALPAHAGRLSGRVAAYAPVDAAVCDTLGVAVGTAHIVHGRIMAGTVKAWEDSVSASPGTAWELYYPALAPGTYQATAWTTKATNEMVGCPEVLSFNVAPAYSIVFGWSTVGALMDNSTGRIIGTAEVMRLLNDREGPR